MIKLAYFSERENRFYEKTYYETNECAINDFFMLKKRKVPFLCATHYETGETKMEAHGLGFGTPIEISEIPEKIAEIVIKILDKLNKKYYSGEQKCVYILYESTNWFGLWAMYGKDAFGDELIFRMFVTKDAKSILYV